MGIMCHLTNRKPMKLVLINRLEGKILIAFYVYTTPLANT